MEKNFIKTMKVLFIQIRNYYSKTMQSELLLLFTSGIILFLIKEYSLINILFQLPSPQIDNRFFACWC